MPPGEVGTAEAPTAPVSTGGRQGISARDVVAANPLAAARILEDNAGRLVDTKRASRTDRRFALDSRGEDREDARFLSELGSERATQIREDRTAQVEADEILRTGINSEDPRVRSNAEAELAATALDSEPGTFAFNTVLGRTLDNVFKNSDNFFSADPLRAGGIESLSIVGSEIVQDTGDGGTVSVLDLSDTDELVDRGVTQDQLAFILKFFPRGERVGVR